MRRELFDDPALIVRGGGQRLELPAVIVIVTWIRHVARRTDSAEQTVFHDAVDRARTIPPADLLSFRVGATIVRDADLVDPDTSDTREFRRHLGLEPEAVLFNRDLLDDFAPEGLIARLHVA